jgi:ornithine cyclodeaminase/alanine dehydrogenase
MNSKLLYLTAADVRSLAIGPEQARTAILSAFERHFRGMSHSLKKASLSLGAGHGFQAMVAADADAGVATVKWVAMSPVEPGSQRAGINGVICVSDYVTGEPVAVMDGNEVTLIRTAALSAAAASLMVSRAPKTIGMIGCGMQAYGHLAAFHDLFPSLEHVYACSLQAWHAEKLVEAANRRGLTGEISVTPGAALENSDILISMVPGGPGLVPFLDANRLKKDVFVSAVDLGRSWLPATFPAFDFLATDSLSQGNAPSDVNGDAVSTVTYHTDLTALTGEKSVPAGGRKLFCFKGYALADLAIADLAFNLAKQRDVGIQLPR